MTVLPCFDRNIVSLPLKNADRKRGYINAERHPRAIAKDRLSRAVATAMG